MSPWAVTNLGLGLLAVEKMCKTIPLEAPWEAKDAAEWDRISLAEWIDKNTMSKPAGEMLDMALAGPYTSAASEVSVLWMLLQMASAGGPTFVISSKGGSQDARPVGGMGAIYGPMAATLGDGLHLSQPVRHITQDGRRRHGSSGRFDGAGPPGDRGDSAGDRQLDRLRADVARGPGISAPAHAEWCGLQDLGRVRRAVLACRRAIRPVRRTGIPRHVDHRCLHGHGGPRGSCVSLPRESKRADWGGTRRGRAQSGASLANSWLGWQ